MTEFGRKLMLFDGGMGSELVKTGIACPVPEDLNVTHPDVIRKIHDSYAGAGADFITTNTFGLNRLKYKGEYDIPSVAKAAIANARATGKRVFFDIGPTGKLLRPLGTVDFEEAYEAFREIVLASRDLVDGYILETFSDLYELKAAVLAVKESCDKPVFATMTFDKTGRTLTGTTPEIMVAFLEEMCVDALGVNCSLGPKELSGVVRRILACTHTPVIVQPNRGLPRLENGVSVYDLTVEEFTESAEEFAKMGVSVLGGCCGTSPLFIGSIAKYKGQEVKMQSHPRTTQIASYAALTKVTDDTVYATLAVSGDTSEDECEDLAYEVLDMADEGAEVVCIEANGILPKTLRTLIEKIQQMTSVPLRLKSGDETAQRCFERYYNGTVK